MNLFKQTWDYGESFIITACILIFSFLLEITGNYEIVNFPGWPYNAIILILYVTILIISYSFYKHTDFIRWISGIPASVTSIILFTVIALATAVIPQTNELVNSGIIGSFKHLQSSWLFIFPFIYFLTVLGFVILRKSWNFQKRNIFFFANHFGLWLVLISAGLGSSDLKKYAISLEEGKSNNLGYNEKAEYVKLPFTIKLIDFHIDEYPPKVALVKLSNNKIDIKAKNNLFLLEKGKTEMISDYMIEIKEYINAAVYDSINGYVNTTGILGSPAAKITAKNSKGTTLAEGWICCGNSNVPAAYVPVNNIYFLAMIYPETKKYSSLIEINHGNKKTIKTQLIVNKPFSIKGWKLYQMSFDTEKGKHSKISVIEAVKDPWLPFVYIGFFMIIGGSLYLFWKGRTLN